MARFPARDAEATALAREMVEGYLANPDDFPNADVAALQIALAEYSAASETYAALRAESAAARETKDGKREALRKAMRNQLRTSELDAGDDPKKLRSIGWGTKELPTPLRRPGMVRNLQVVSQAPGTVHLKWKSAAKNSGGAVKTYLVKCRELKEGE